MEQWISQPFYILWLFHLYKPWNHALKPSCNAYDTWHCIDIHVHVFFFSLLRFWPLWVDWLLWLPIQPVRVSCTRDLLLTLASVSPSQWRVYIQNCRQHAVETFTGYYMTVGSARLCILHVYTWLVYPMYIIGSYCTPLTEAISSCWNGYCFCVYNYPRVVHDAYRIGWFRHTPSASTLYQISVASSRGNEAENNPGRWHGRHISHGRPFYE